MKSKIKSNKFNITKEFIIQEYVQNKKSILRIAKEIGVPHETLYEYKNKFGIPTYSNTFWFKGKSNTSRTKFKKGQTPWNKGKFGLVKGWNLGRKWSEDEKQKISIRTKEAMQRPHIKEKIKLTQFQKGIVPWNKNKTNVYREETIKQIKEARLKQIFPKKDTNAEISLFNILNELSIRFSKHVPIKSICQVDAFVGPNTILFADGDYWHCNPNFFPEPKTKAQLKNLKRDKIANDKLIKEGFIVLRFWEFDLLNNKDNCKEIIKNLLE